MLKRARFLSGWIGAFLFAASAVDAASAACRLKAQGDGRVAQIVDARTFRLDDGREVRLSGIEPGLHAQTPAVLSGLIGGQIVTLHGEDDRPDRYGRQGAYVFGAGSDTSLQTQLLALGEAVISHSPADADCAREWIFAEAGARAAKRGFWGDPAATKNTERPGDILARVGQFAVVEGRVVSAREAGGIFYINFGRRWTRDFAVTISRRMIPSFASAGINLKTLEGKRLRVRGWVERSGGPRIEAVRPEQIEIVAGGGGIATTGILKSEGQ